jgi:hypothetical protein
MKRAAPAAVVLTVVILTAGRPQAQSLNETLVWMENTLRPSEGNNVVIHRPYPHRPSDWIRDNLDPYHAQTITNFIHAGCRVELDVDIADNDMITGKHFTEHDTASFDLGDIDLNSIRTKNTCKPFQTPTGPTTPLNCADEQGKFIIFHTANATPKVHEELMGASWKSGYHSKDGVHEELTGDFCKSMPNNGNYCDEPQRRIGSVDVTFSQLGFSTRAYARRFAKAFRHAVTLCGGKSSTF